MVYLLLAILSSAMVSIMMRLSTHKVSGNISMLSMNYLMCLVIAGLRTNELLPSVPELPQTLGMGVVHGILYLLSFVLFQVNVKKNGVVLSAVFMKLGLLVPMVVSVCLFHDIPRLLQILGFFIAIAGIILINFEHRASVKEFMAGLILLLLGGGCADAMSKVFEELGSSSLSEQFLFYTFLVAWLLCTGSVLWKREQPGKAEVLFGLLIGIPNYCSAHFLLKSLEKVSAVIAYPTYSVATIFVVSVAGVLLFRERLKKRQWIALGVILVALVLLNI